MPDCYICDKKLPVTQFYLLRIYPDEKSSLWWYACDAVCLKDLVLRKTRGYNNFLLREYMITCGKAWRFSSREELLKFVENLA